MHSEFPLSNTITLLCWVIGTPIKRIFPIKIEHDAIWGSVDLKKAIKEEKNEFADIDADTLIRCRDWTPTTKILCIYFFFALFIRIVSLPTKMPCQNLFNSRSADKS